MIKTNNLNYSYNKNDPVLKDINLSFKRGEITVKGENLYIKKYSAGDVAICGKIISVERT